MHRNARVWHPLLSTGAVPVLMMLSLALSGCVTLPRDSFAEAEQSAASPPGFAHVRYAEDDPALAELMRKSVRSARGEMNALAISGGGANGAYGAGLLVGWTRAGTRPEFQLVTGVSAGALTAPFAFLGSGWDDRLQQAFLGESSVHLLRRRAFLGLFTPGFFDGELLRQLVHRYVTDDMIRAVAAEHARGRRLLVATTNLDTEQLVIWDMGSIAAKGGAAARELFVTVLVASASVPAVFPPTMIQVEGNGRTFNEMHVDGGTESAFFAIPDTLLLAGPLPPDGYKRHLFVIVNGQLDNYFSITRRSTISIIHRTVEAAGKASTRSVLFTTAEFCVINGCDLKVAALPSSQKDASLNFSAAHLQSLFAAGETDIANDTAWHTGPPKR
jgi:hypothetical protein